MKIKLEPHQLEEAITDYLKKELGADIGERYTELYFRTGKKEITMVPCRFDEGHEVEIFIDAKVGE